MTRSTKRIEDASAQIEQIQSLDKISQDKRSILRTAQEQVRINENFVQKELVSLCKVSTDLERLKRDCLSSSRNIILKYIKNGYHNDWQPPE